MTLLRPQPLTKEAFAPFGDVIESVDVAALNINQGFAERFNNLASVDVTAEDGSTNVSLFTAQPRPQPIVIDLMERHPLGSQLFYPLQDEPWMVLVCRDPQDSESYSAFMAHGRQGVNYKRNVWHFPLLVFGADSRFLVVDRIGPGKNLVEVAVSPFSLQPQTA
jgi:ureidoglycolate lyase